MSESDFHLQIVNWQSHEPELRDIRTQVFIQEQKVPVQLEWDEEDKTCIHILVSNKVGKAVATGRILNNGQIGRMAVVKAYRRQGIGKLILKTLLKQAHLLNLESVFLNAQIDAVEFYKPFGFSETGSRFNDAGIQHIRMIKTMPET